MQLSRALARLGHHVTHQYCSSYTTGRGALDKVAADPDTLTIESLSLGHTFERYSTALRVRQELEYAGIATQAILEGKPDVAILSNIPLLSLMLISHKLDRAGVPTVFWQQDVYSAAIGSAARRRLGPLGTVIGYIAERIERRVARRSKAVVPISDAFVDKLTGWGIARERIHVIPNWAPIAELPVTSRENTWAVAHGLVDVPVVLYGGTLGLKHDPMLLVAAAASLRDRARVVVVTEGLGRNILEKQKAEQCLDNLTLLDFQPYEELPNMLGSADVLIALLEPDASKYSVPSKVLSYLCSCRPIVAVIPADNSVAMVLTDVDAGIVVPPGDHEGFVQAVRRLLDDSAERQAMGSHGRKYAEEAFDVDQIAQRFESITATVRSD